MNFSARISGKKHLELFFCSFVVVQPLHNFPQAIKHLISVKFQSANPLLYYGNITFLHGLAARLA